MPGLTVVLTGDSTPLEREFKKVDALSKRLGTSIGGNMASGVNHGSSGVVRESLTILREASRGNFSKIPGSLSILAQYLGLTKVLFEKNATAAGVAANFYGKVAEKANAAAMASAHKAAKSAAAFEADTLETEGLLEVALADEAKALADAEVAVAANKKAEASLRAAAAQEAEAVATGANVAKLSLLAKVGILAGIALAGIYGLVKSYKGGLGKLLETELVSQNKIVKPIAESEQKAGRMKEHQRQINVELEKTVRLYNSASDAAKRVLEIQKQNFEHSKNMLDAQKEYDMARATGRPLEQMRIEKQHLKDIADLNKKQRDAEISAKEKEAGNYAIESAKRKREANLGELKNLASKAQDETLLEQKKANADKAREYLAAIETRRNTEYLDPQKARSEFIEQASRSGFKTFGIDINKNEQENIDKAHEWIKAERKAINEVDQRDKLRQRQAELLDESKSAAAKAKQTELEITQQKKINDLKTSGEKTELAIKLKTLQAEYEHSSFMLGSLTSNQRLGAYSAPAARMLTYVSNIERNTAVIAQRMGAAGAPVNTDPGNGFLGVRF